MVLGNGQALRYGIGVGRVGFTWSGVNDQRPSAMKTNERSERLRADVLTVLRDSVCDKTFPGAVAALISRDDETYIA